MSYGVRSLERTPTHQGGFSRTRRTTDDEAAASLTGIAQCLIQRLTTAFLGLSPGLGARGGGGEFWGEIQRDVSDGEGVLFHLGTDLAAEQFQIVIGFEDVLAPPLVQGIRLRLFQFL